MQAERMEDGFAKKEVYVIFRVERVRPRPNIAAVLVDPRRLDRVGKLRVSAKFSVTDFL